MPNFLEDEEVQAIYYTILDEWQLTKDVIFSYWRLWRTLGRKPYLKRHTKLSAPYLISWTTSSWSWIKRQRVAVNCQQMKKKLIHM